MALLFQGLFTGCHPRCELKGWPAGLSPSLADATAFPFSPKQGGPGLVVDHKGKAYKLKLAVYPEGPTRMPVQPPKYYSKLQVFRPILLFV